MNLLLCFSCTSEVLAAYFSNRVLNRLNYDETFVISRRLYTFLWSKWKAATSLFDSTTGMKLS